MGKIFMLALRRLYKKYAVQGGIWILTQNLLEDQGKPRKTLTDMQDGNYCEFISHRKHKNQGSSSILYERTQS